MVLAGVIGRYMPYRINLFTTTLFALETSEPYDEVLYDDFLGLAKELYPLADIIILRHARSASVTGLYPYVATEDAGILQPILERMSLQPGWRPTL